MSDSIQEIINDTDVSEMSLKAIEEKYSNAVDSLTTRRAEMHADVDLIYQLHLNETKEYYEALIAKKKLHA